MSLTTVLVVVVVIALLLLLFQAKTFIRIAAAFGAQTNKLGRAVWGYDPVAVFQAQVDQAADEIRQAHKGLEEYQTLVAGLNRQVESGSKEKNRLEALIKSALANGNESRATDLAMQLARVEKDLEANLGQLKTYENSYKANLEKIQHANRKIQEAKERARKLSADLKLSRAEAETAKLAERFNVNTVSLDGLGEIEEEINRQIDQNRGKARVATDMAEDGLADIRADEEVRKQEAQDILARFRTATTPQS